MRLLYNLLWCLILPLALLRLWWRGQRESGYLQHIAERLGYFKQAVDKPVIWLHAVSLGETRAAEALIRALQERYPNHQILITHMTATGRAASEELFGDSVLRCWLPYDLPWFMFHFLAHFKPVLGLIMETEVWPNLMRAVQQQGVPVVLVNARLSEKSLKQSLRLLSLAQPAYAGFSKVLAQTALDADRLRIIGAPLATITGNLKFDMTLPADKLALGKQWKQALSTRRICLCASTREGEEALILQAWRHEPRPEDILLLIVPRHPQRFDEVAQLITQEGLTLARRSDWDGQANISTTVMLGDSLGEMIAYYSLADVAYIGGSLLPLGGQNLIEACAAGCPVLLGPHTFNFAQASQDAIAAGAARRVADVWALIQQATQLLDDGAARQTMSAAGYAFAEANRGALVRTLSEIEKLLGE